MTAPLLLGLSLGAIAAAMPQQTAPEKPIRPLPARLSGSLLPRAGGESAFASPEAALRAGKVALGEGVEASSDVRRRLEAFERARRGFEAAVAFGDGAPLAVRAEAQAFLSEIVKELPPADPSGGAARFDVLVIGLELERRTIDFDARKYEDLLRKLDRAGKAGDPDEIAKAREASSRETSVKTEWTSRDESVMKKSLSDARKEVQRLSRGRVDFDGSFARYPNRVPEPQGGGRGRRWALNPLHPFEDAFGAEVAAFVLAREPRPDFVVLAPKMDRRGESVPGPSFEDELRYPLPALGGGLVGVLHLAFREADDPRDARADGSAAARPPTLAEKLVAALYVLLRDRVPSAVQELEAFGRAGAPPAFLPEVPGSAADGLLDSRRRDVSNERRRFLEKAWAEHVTGAMIRALADRNDVFRRRVVPETADPGYAALFDGDLGTRVTVRAGEPVVIDFRRAVEARGVAFAVPAAPAGVVEPTPAGSLAVTFDDGSALWALPALASGSPIERYELDSPLRIASLRLFLADGPPREISEIVLSGR